MNNNNDLMNNNNAQMADKIKKFIVDCVLFVASLIKRIWNELNPSIPVRYFYYCPGWTGTGDGFIDLQNAENEFCNAGLNNYFASIYLVDVIPENNGNCYLYVFDVVGSLHMVNGKKVQVKNSTQFQQVITKVSTKACITAARYWKPNSKGANGLVFTQLSQGYLSVYVALNDDGIKDNLSRIKIQQINNSPKRQKATVAAATTAATAPPAKPKK